MENNNVQKELGWEDSIQQDNEFQLLPEGWYNFEVLSFERARHNGSAKLPPCNKAILKLRIWSEVAEGTIMHNLFLHSSMEGMLCAFFTAVSLRKHGERINMDWSQVIGSIGRCKVGVREWINDKGEKRQSNQITQFYQPNEEEQKIMRESVQRPYNEGSF